MNSAIAHCELPLLTAKSFRDALEVTDPCVFQTVNPKLKTENWPLPLFTELCISYFYFGILNCIKPFGYE